MIWLQSLPPSPLFPSKVFNQAALDAKTARELTEALVEFIDCSIVIPPTEIKDEAMLSSIINFQKKFLKDRQHSSEIMPRRDSKAHRGEGLTQHIVRLNTKISLYVKSFCPKYFFSPVSISGGSPAEDPLSRTGRPFGGMIRDIKRRYQYYKSDLTDALNAQALAAIIFIYFAALSPAITFGGLLGEYDVCMWAVPLFLSSGHWIFCLFSWQGRQYDGCIRAPAVYQHPRDHLLFCSCSAHPGHWFLWSSFSVRGGLLRCESLRSFSHLFSIWSLSKSTHPQFLSFSSASPRTSSTS